MTQQQTLQNLIDKFTVSVRPDLLIQYKEFEPRFQKIINSFNAGMVAQTNYPFWGFVGGMQKFKDSRKYRKVPISSNYVIKHHPYDNAVSIPVQDLERAASVQNPLSQLNLYEKMVMDMGKQAKESPVEEAFKFIEAGATNTLGTAFDGKNYFATDHTYLDDPTPHSNLLTGSGTSTSQLKTDILRALRQFNTYTYKQQNQDEGNTMPRKFNNIQDINQNILVAVPNELFDIAYDLKNSMLLSNDTNTVQNFDFISLSFQDPNDIYVFLVDDPNLRPIISPIEKPLVLDTPSANDQSAKDHEVYNWGAKMRFGTGYGAWWKAIKFTNA